MRIATFNINSIRGRLARLTEWLDEARPDVVCLQELRIYHEEFPLAAIHACGYRALWQGQKPRYNGVAILARASEPIEVRRRYRDGTLVSTVGDTSFPTGTFNGVIGSELANSASDGGASKA